MKYVLMTVTFLTLGGCVSARDWTPAYEQPGGIREGEPYRYNGTPVRDLGDYGRRPGTCTSTGIVQWDINWEVQ